MEKILVIENDLNLFGNIKEMLEKYHYHVLYANKGKEGIAIAVKEIPELVICDVQLPDIDAFQVFKLSRNSMDTKLLPFLFLTDAIPQNDSHEDLGVAKSDFILKSIKTNELLLAIKVKLSKFKPILNKDFSKIDNIKEFTNEDYIFLELGKNLSSVRINNIICLLAKGNYTFIITDKGKKFTVRKLLKDIGNILPRESFLRIHRSAYINLNYVKNIEKWSSGTLRVHMHNYDLPLSISRRYSKVVRDKIIC